MLNAYGARKNTIPTSTGLDGSMSTADEGKTKIDERAAKTIGKPWADSEWRAARFNEAYLEVESKYGRFFAGRPGWS